MSSSAITPSTLPAPRSATPQWPVRAAERTSFATREAVAAKDSVETLRRPVWRESSPRGGTNLDPWQRTLTAQARAALRAYGEWATPPVTERPDVTLVSVDLYV